MEQLMKGLLQQNCSWLDEGCHVFVLCRVSRLGQRGERPNQMHFPTDSARPQLHLKPRPSVPPDWWRLTTPIPLSSFLNLLSHSFTQTFAEVTFRLLLYFPPPVWPLPLLFSPVYPSSPILSSLPSDGATPAVLQRRTQVAV